MKKIILSLLILAACGTFAAAQNSQRQKVIHMAAMRIAGQIQVSGQDMDRFVRTYQSYKKEVAVIMSEPCEVAADGSERAVESKIVKDFEKSERILKVRKEYYHRFRLFLQPSQIQKMYDLERAQAGR